MVGLKENLIKLSDYPFIYSVTGSLFVMIFQKNINPLNPSFNELIPILIFIGIIGTIISIIDPVGRLAKSIIFKLNGKFRIDSNYKLATNIDPLFKKAIHARWIEYEIEKLVSTFYFIIVLVLLIIILANPVNYNAYIQFVSLNLNSTTINQNSNDSISTSNNKDSEQTPSNSGLYSKIRDPALVIFIFLSVGIGIVFTYSCLNLKGKIQTIIDYFQISYEIDLKVYGESRRTEITNLDKNFLDTVNAYDWELAREFVDRIKRVSERKEDSRINPTVSSANKSNETK